MAEKALTAVNQEACVQDISTRSVDDLTISSRHEQYRHLQAPGQKAARRVKEAAERSK
jgi:hypothetical protein